MTHQELELWAREITAAVLDKKRIEDSRIELKSGWPEPGKAAHHLAAHANAARGTPILWLIGVDEKAPRLTNPNPVELANWFQSVGRFFDGDGPRLVLDTNVRLDDHSAVVLYFETHQGSPFVVKNPQGGYPEFTVPWREGTRKRAARREDLLTILVPIRRFTNRANQIVLAAVNSLAIATTFGDPLSRAWKAVTDCKGRIEDARKALSRFLKTV